jgi:drug/metabolite transporter (DMT)-like permease
MGRSTSAAHVRAKTTAQHYVEPVVTVVLAFVVFGESLGPAQLAGGALVLMAVVAVRVPVGIPSLKLEQETT